MAALLVKVGTVLLKQLAKPLSSRFQAYVMSHPVARTHAINASQSLHQIEVWLTRSADGKTGKAFIGKMSEEKSIEMASKFVSEGFVAVVGIGIVAFEYVRQTRKEIAKKFQEKEEKDRLRGMEEDERAAFRSNVTRSIEVANDQLEQITRRLKLLEDQVADKIDCMVEEEKQRQASSKSRGLFGGFFSSPPATIKVVPSSARTT